VPTNPPPDEAAIRERQRADWNRAAAGWRQRAAAGGGDTTLTDRLIAMAGIRTGQRVLDLACGVGDPALAIAALVGPAGTVLGLDLTQAMLDGARAFAQQRGLGNVAFRRIDSELDLGVPDRSFDAATCRFGLMFMPDPARALATVRRALKPGARVAVCTWGPPERVPYFSVLNEIVRRHADLPQADPAAPGPMRLSTPEVLAGILRDAGFGAVETDSLETFGQVADTPEAYWEARTEPSGQLGMTLASLPEETRRAIREDAIRTLQEMFPTGPVRLGGEVLVAAGVNLG
jgi:ubiquinone/menaquinone biosynthesis C-methylase UbiE